jgi:hypothetical protein
MYYSPNMAIPSGEQRLPPSPCELRLRGGFVYPLHGWTDQMPLYLTISSGRNVLEARPLLVSRDTGIVAAAIRAALGAAEQRGQEDPTAAAAPESKSTRGC